MKITDPEVIERGERDLMDGIIADLDWILIEKIFKERHRLNIEDDVEYQKGDLVVHDDKIAYELNFQVKLNLSIFCDRDGNYIDVKSSLDIPDDSAPDIQSMPETKDKDQPETPDTSDDDQPETPDTSDDDQPEPDTEDESQTETPDTKDDAPPTPQPLESEVDEMIMGEVDDEPVEDVSSDSEPEEETTPDEEPFNQEPAEEIQETLDEEPLDQEPAEEIQKHLMR
ncbi:MAG: hypothetical protein OMM_07564, partial [Candidatus Magnetoglobus multicellularis str. Araruama]